MKTPEITLIPDNPQGASCMADDHVSAASVASCLSIYGIAVRGEAIPFWKIEASGSLQVGLGGKKVILTAAL